MKLTIRQVFFIVLFLGLFLMTLRPIADPDFWWHLKTGQYVWQQHSLPVPDPFAYTTATARPAYAGEERTRDFNLTHEWLAQALFYLIYRAAGIGGLVLFRAAVLTAFCALAGLLAWRRCGGAIHLRPEADFRQHNALGAIVRARILARLH